MLEESWMDALKQFIGAWVRVEQEIVEESLRSLDKLVEEIKKDLNFALEPKVLKGNTLNTIVDTVLDFDLLVLGAHGQHPVRALALGTTSQRILSKTKKPVLVVKQKPDTSYQRVLVAVDFSPNSRKALAFGPVIAPQALIHVVHVFEPLFERKMISAGAFDKTIEEYRIKAQSEAKREMTDFITATGMRFNNLNVLVEYGHAAGKLPEIADKWDPDLIIIGKHGRSRMEELLLGSVTLHMLSLSRCDVLVVG